MGISPALLTRPTVGLMATSPLRLPGHINEPKVSVPMATVARSAATATADPLLDPHGLRSRT